MATDCNFKVEYIAPWHDARLGKDFFGMFVLEGKLEDNRTLFVRVNLASLAQGFKEDFYAHLSYSEGERYWTERLDYDLFLKDPAFQVPVGIYRKTLSDILFGGREHEIC